jgi:hypothetical protein
MRWSAVALIVSIILITKHHECLAEATFAFAQRSDGHLAWGASWDKPTVEGASSDALSKCERSGGQGQCSARDSFHKTCVALVVQNGSNWYEYHFALEKKVAEDSALNACGKMRQGRRCHIAISFCDRMEEEMLICAKPVFPELHKLKETIAGEPSKVEFVKQATLYLLYKYCTTINRELTKSRTEQINEFCDMYSDTSNVEGPVYWEQCRSAE